MYIRGFFRGNCQYGPSGMVPSDGNNASFVSKLIQK